MATADLLRYHDGEVVKILVADDSPTTLHMLESRLLEWGYDVVTAVDGDGALAAIEAVDADPPLLAILDWLMPGLSGVEICRRLRQVPGLYRYIILLTAKGSPADVVEGLAAGADDYLIKPVDLLELEVRVRAGCRILELQTALREQATRDSLTGCWNRAALLENLSRELARASRERRPLSVLMVDLDNFKVVNDTQGHAAGDLVLCEAASRMRTSMRPYDLLARYGGDEFIVLLPGCDEQNAVRHAERLRVALSQDPIEIGELPARLTASIGVTCIPPGSIFAEDTILLAADEALYQAKRQGRNRVISASLRAQA